jgi:predicted lipid-binding transport protein (Tim44 family)
MVYLDLIILAAVAFFLGYRLWGLLGTHDPDTPLKRKDMGLDEGEFNEAVRKSAPSYTPGDMTPTVDLDKTDYFNETEFLKGAEAAFQMILENFAGGTLKEIKPLLSKEIYDLFSSEIDERNKNNQVMELDLTRIVKAEVISNTTVKGTQSVTVEFISEQTTVIRDQSDAIVSGDPDHYEEITDRWTFSRQVDSKDPNWILTSTQGNAPA